jgi:hypothetical protein
VCHFTDLGGVCLHHLRRPRGSHPLLDTWVPPGGRIGRGLWAPRILLSGRGHKLLAPGKEVHHNEQNQNENQDDYALWNREGGAVRLVVAGTDGERGVLLRAHLYHPLHAGGQHVTLDSRRRICGGVRCSRFVRWVSALSLDVLLGV